MSSEKDCADMAMPEVCRVGIRMPPFWQEQPAVWFHQLKAQFTLNCITVDGTKYCYVMSNLDAKYACEVQDLFDTPPEANTYETLKRELIQRLSVSREKKILQLLEKEEIGDRKPSQFLRHMQSLAGKTVTD
ncbi:uncharacterized protein LOC144477728, partial [Augochlora pura]